MSVLGTSNSRPAAGNYYMLHDRNAKCGEFLFRWRSYLPLLLVIPFLFAMGHVQYFCGSHVCQQGWAWACLSVSLCGVAIRVATVGYVADGTSGRNTKRQIANELNTTGMYSVCRNPLYLGNLAIWLGVVVYLRNVALMTIFVMAYWLYYERIIAAEEAFLVKRFGRKYLNWCRRTPVFFPQMRKWQPPARVWSWRVVLRREYTTVWLVAFAFFALDTVAHLIVEQRVHTDPSWTLLFAMASAAYIIIRHLKKHSSVLNTDSS